MNAKDKRYEMIQKLVEAWIGQDDKELGQIITDRTFADLRMDVCNLRTFGRGDSWQYGVDKFEDCVVKALSTFADQNEIPYIKAWHSNGSDYTFTTRREFHKMLKWAIMQGAVFVSLAN